MLGEPCFQPRSHVNATPIYQWTLKTLLKRALCEALLKKQCGQKRDFKHTRDTKLEIDKFYTTLFNTYLQTIGDKNN